MKVRAATAAALALLAGLAAAQPACPVATVLQAPPNPVTAGRGAGIKLTIKASAPIRNLNVAIHLPSNCCMVKGRVQPSLKATTSPTRKAPIVEGQNVYWLDVPLTGKKTSSRLFSLGIGVSSLYTNSATVPITAMVYSINSTGAATCVSTVQPASVRRGGGGSWL